ncbi:MAG: NifU family protein [Bacteroidia bacterium]|nr:NifU family protein [Bacteroidia bacterium]
MTKRTALLHVEGVPNPNAIKIVLENGILADEPYEYRDYREAASSPLAQNLLMLRYVDRVFLNRNYVTLVKTGDLPRWDEVLPELRAILQQHLEENEPILYLGAQSLQHARSDEVVMELARDLLNRYIRPAAQEDGGDIVIESFSGGVLNLNMHGACHRCPYAPQTMKEGVEKVLMGMIPEIRKVTATGNHVL